jgi:hypothetical protein
LISTSSFFFKKAKKGIMSAANPDGATTVSKHLYKLEIAFSNCSTEGFLLIPYKVLLSSSFFISLM